MFYLHFHIIYCVLIFACAEGGLEDPQACVQACGRGGVVGGCGLGAEINIGPPFVSSS